MIKPIQKCIKYQVGRVSALVIHNWCTYICAQWRILIKIYGRAKIIYLKFIYLILLLLIQ